MLTHVAALLLNRPRAIETVGELTSRVAAAALIAGVLIHTVAGVLESLPGAKSGSFSAEGFLPGLPTWWIPESPTGFTAWAAVLAAGLYAIYAGRTLRHQLEAI